jgi:hypothetical protein
VNGTLDSQGHNLIGDGTAGSGFADTDLVGTSSNPIDPLLEPLGDYGGPTQTMALMPGSPALNTGDPAELETPEQRGVVRSGGVNIGAFQASAGAFMLDAPKTVSAGVPFDLAITAVDVFSQVAVGYVGTATFSTTDSDPDVVLPADHGFTLDDGGTYVFTDTGRGETTLLTPGEQTLTVRDSAVDTITGSAPITVVSGGAGAGRLLPGDARLGAVTVNASSPSVQFVPERATVNCFFASTRRGDFDSLPFPIQDGDGMARRMLDWLGNWMLLSIY